MKRLVLKAVSPKDAEPSKPKVLIYGKSGVGKTWTALDFPNVYYIDTEGGADLAHYTDKLKKSNGVYFGPKQGSLDFDTIIEQVEALATQEHEFKTLVIDSISKIYNNDIIREAERLGSKNGFGADKRPAIKSMKRLVSWLNKLDMNVVIIAHEKAEWANGDQIGNTFDAWEKLEYELHLCLNIIKRGPQRLWTVRKSRLTGFSEGSTGDWSFKNFAKHYGEEAINNISKPVTLITDDQINELNNLMQNIRTQDGWLEKCMKKADVDRIEDFLEEEAQKMIDFLKKMATL